MLYSIQTLVGEGDEGIYPDPGFPMYRSLIQHSGATGVPLPIRESKQFSFDPDDFHSRLSDKTRLIILNYPHNPTGGTLTRSDLELIADAARERDIAVLADEIYINFLYDGEFFSIAALPGMADRTIILDGFSKSYSMTGWRIGYAAGPAKIIGAMKKIQSQSTSNPASISQAAATAALDGPQDCVQEMGAAFKERHDYLVEALNALPGVECLHGDGTFYVLPSFQAAIDADSGVSNDVEFAEKL